MMHQPKTVVNILLGIVWKQVPIHCSTVLESKFFKHVYIQNQMENTSQYAITN